MVLLSINLLIVILRPNLAIWRSNKKWANLKLNTISLASDQDSTLVMPGLRLKLWGARYQWSLDNRRGPKTSPFLRLWMWSRKESHRWASGLDGDATPEEVVAINGVFEGSADSLEGQGICELEAAKDQGEGTVGDRCMLKKKKIEIDTPFFLGVSGWYELN